MDINFDALSGGFNIAIWCIVGVFALLTIAVIVGSRIEHSHRMKTLTVFRDTILPELEALNTTLEDINVTLENEVEFHQGINEKLNKNSVQHQYTLDYLAKTGKNEHFV